jgi:hypothetical protein
VLLAELPRESALARAIDPDMARWSAVEELLALIAEQVDLGNRMFFQVNTDKTAKQPVPLRVRRPRDGELARMSAESEPTVRVVENPKMATSEEIAAFFGGGVVHYFPNPDAN